VGRVGTRHDKQPRRVASSATEMDCVNELYQLVEAMARSLEKVREPVGEQLPQLVRGVHEVARKLETRLVKEAAATSANGELKEQHRDEGAESHSQLTGGGVAATPRYRPAGMSDGYPSSSDDEEWDARYPSGQHWSVDDDDDGYWFLEEWGQRH
jgi:hypothetical protein